MHTKYGLKWESSLFALTRVRRPRLAGFPGIKSSPSYVRELEGVRSYLLPTPLDFDTLDQLSLTLGMERRVFLGKDDEVVCRASYFRVGLGEESCGPCTHCLNGVVSF